MISWERKRGVIVNDCREQPVWGRPPKACRIQPANDMPPLQPATPVLRPCQPPSSCPPLSKLSECGRSITALLCCAVQYSKALYSTVHTAHYCCLLIAAACFCQPVSTNTTDTYTHSPSRIVPCPVPVRLAYPAQSVLYNMHYSPYAAGTPR